MSNASVKTNSKTKSRDAYLQLRRMIRDGHLPNGEPLTAAKAARLVGTSRGPARESLLKLQAEGYLTSRGARRSRVVAYTEDETPQELLARYEVREYIEAGAARLAAKNMTGWQIDQLRGLAIRVKEAFGADDRQWRYAAAHEFHSYLVQNCGNPLIAEVWTQQQLSPNEPRTAAFEERLQQLVRQEQPEGFPLIAVVDAIGDHDENRAEATMKDQVRIVSEALRKMAHHGDSEEVIPPSAPTLTE